MTTELDPRDVRGGKPPDDPDAAIDWLNNGAQLIIDAVDRVGADARVWTFNGPRPAGWWIRRRVHEVAVHRADAAMALGVDYDPAPELAADGISEWVELMTVQAKREAPPVDRGRRLHLHATDGALGPTGEWTIVNDEDGVELVSRARQGRCRAAWAREGSVAGDRAQAHHRRGRCRGVRRRLGLGPVARAHAVLSGVPSRP